MFKINKITSNSVVDFAAEELKKYLRMMMPLSGDIDIKYAPGARDGFQLGLMQDFGLDVSDADEPELDDILYIDTDKNGGIIAGDNPRSVLLAVYEYLRQNGCRWLYPGIDGEFIPIRDIAPIKYRHKPSCRYRGQCNEGAEYQPNMMEAIDFTPKVGMNVFMIEFRIPVCYYDSYYNHVHNQENRTPEPVSEEQVLQWKRQCETEIAKRGLQLHDIGHGFTMDPFGIDSSKCSQLEDGSDLIPEENRKYVALLNGERNLYLKSPLCTNFCMSNKEAREKVASYVCDYASKNTGVDYLHVWLADYVNNHCECDECRKKTVSDWYVILMNEIDEMLTKAKLNTRIVFIVYVDSTWAPLVERIKNPKRFTLLLAPISRSYTSTISDNVSNIQLRPFELNKLVLPSSLDEYCAYFNEWKKIWKGANVSYEYHFWRHQFCDASGLSLAKRVNEDIKAYKKNDVNGIIEDGSQRSFFPNGYAFYTYARTLFDTSLNTDEIAEEYFSAAYGDNWKEFYDYLAELDEVFDFKYMEQEASEDPSISPVYSPKRAKELEKVKDITKRGRELIKANYNHPIRVRTVSVRLLEKHADYCDMLAAALIPKALGEDEKASLLFEKLRVEFGKEEIAIERYYDHSLAIKAHGLIFSAKSNKPEPVINF